jgi:hypothetical protein
MLGYFVLLVICVIQCAIALSKNNPNYLNASDREEL